MRRLLAAIALALCGAAGAAEPFVLGVQTHFAYGPGKTDAALFRDWMRRAGFTSSRDEMFWWDVEDAAGTLALRGGALHTRSVWTSMPPPFAGLLTVDFGHPRHDRGGQPKTDAGRAAFARYAGFVTARNLPPVRWVEVWNEWNMPTPDERRLGDTGSAEDYVRLARETHARLKAAHPGLTVVVGSPGDDRPDWPWLRKAIAAGLLQHGDAVGAHLYNHCGPADRVGSDEAAARLDLLRAMLDKAGRPAMPVFVTEVGWPTHQGECGITEAAAARHSLRFLLEASLRPWVAGVWFYELQDGGDDAREREQRFGLLRRDGSEKPAGCVLRELGAQIARRPVSHLAGKPVGVAVFPNAHGATNRWMVWNRGASQRPVSVKLRATQARAVALAPFAPCGLPAADLRLDAAGQVATLQLAPGAVHALDVPAGEVLEVDDVLVAGRSAWERRP